MQQKTPKTTEGRGKKRESTVMEGSAKPAKQRRSMSSGDAALPSLSPKASTDFDDALVAHTSGNHRSKKKDESVKSPVSFMFESQYHMIQSSFCLLFFVTI